MANVQINWSLPSGSLTNITNFTVLRGKVLGNSVGTPQTCTLLQAAAATGPAVGNVNADVECLLVDSGKSAITHTYQSVAAGTYLYGVYAVNGAGANACLADILGDGDSYSVAEIAVA